MPFLWVQLFMLPWHALRCTHIRLLARITIRVTVPRRGILRLVVWQPSCLKCVTLIASWTDICFRCLTWNRNWKHGLAVALDFVSQFTALFWPTEMHCFTPIFSLRKPLSDSSLYYLPSPNDTVLHYVCPTHFALLQYYAHNSTFVLQANPCLRKSSRLHMPQESSCFLLTAANILWLCYHYFS